MNCPLCGEVCSCQPEPLPPALSQRTLTPDSELGPGIVPALISNTLESKQTDPEVAYILDPDRHSDESAAPSDSSAEGAPEDSDAPAWRDELSARLNRYRARRTVRPPRYPSLSLRFEAPEISGANVSRASSLAEFEPISNQALALDGMRHGPSAAAEPDLRYPVPSEKTVTPPVHQPTAKIIEFPRFAWGPPTPPPDQLAEPVSERPRILEVPELVPPPPALGGINIEAAEMPADEKRPGIDIPLQSAPLGLRLVAAFVDGLIIAAAASLFGFIFWKVAAVRPPLFQSLGLLAGITCFFWVAYEYLLIVYAASTPGLRVAGLELSRFDGTRTSRSLRRWRVLAACLSAVSAGMGYAWVFLDEDALCWHDRITHTYLAPKRRGTAETK